MQQPDSPSRSSVPDGFRRLLIISPSLIGAVAMVLLFRGDQTFLSGTPNSIRAFYSWVFMFSPALAIYTVVLLVRWAWKRDFLWSAVAILTLLPLVRAVGWMIHGVQLQT
jgi:hypothetical protein